MEFIAQPIAGLYLIQPKKHNDHRGHFVKSYHEGMFAERGLELDTKESFYSLSFPNVIRGMHFQEGAHAHSKLVYPVAGAVIDVVLDLRTDSPTFGLYQEFELQASEATMLYIPVGLAHGFATKGEDNAILFYHTSTMHQPEADKGVRYDSFGYKWPIAKPIVSERDLALPAFEPSTSRFQF